MAQVLEEYPHVVLSILRGCRTARERGRDGVEYYVTSEPGKPEASHKLRRVDFERCVRVAKKVGATRIFRSEPESDVVDRVRAHLRVEFADRTDP